MIRVCTILKNTNKYFLILIFLSASVEAQFRGQEDIAITRDVLARFGKECPLKVAIDEDIVKKLQTESAQVRETRLLEVQKCYENNYSQVIGVFHLYRKLCDEISLKKKEVSAEQMVRQLLDVSRYQSGIRIFHSVLNDCLTALPERAGRPFIIPLAGTELDIKTLQKQIEEAQVHNPFPATIDPFR